VSCYQIIEFSSQGKLPAGCKGLRYITPVNESELIIRLIARHRRILAPKDAEVVVTAILGATAAGLVKGRRIGIRGFGAFQITRRPARTGSTGVAGPQTRRR